MGNTYALDKDLNIYIETEKPYYNSGSSIQGTIFVHAKRNFQFDALYLRIQGSQWCQWFEGSSKNRRKYTGNQNFYIVEHIIKRFDDQILQVGKYAFPFSLQLSDNIPGSFESQQHHAKISYNLMTYLTNYNHPEKTQTYQHPILIRQPFRQDIVKYTGQANSNVKKWGIFDKGEIRLQVNFDRNVAYEGQDIEVMILADNSRGKDQINRFKVQLVEYTFVSSNGNASRTYRKVVDQKNILERVGRGQARQIQVHFKVPNVKYQTAISTLVANYYRLQISTDFGIGSSKNPCIYAPIFILQKNLDIKEEPLKNQADQYHYHKAVCIRSGEYLFKKNRNLDVCNFRQEDMVTLSVYGSENTFS